MRRGCPDKHTEEKEKGREQRDLNDEPEIGSHIATSSRPPVRLARGSENPSEHAAAPPETPRSIGREQSGINLGRHPLRDSPPIGTPSTARRQLNLTKPDRMRCK